MDCVRLPRPGRPTDPVDVVRAVVIAQVVFTVGHVLTTGGFLYYFANALHPSAFLFSILAVTPELSATAALGSRRVIRRLGSRKRTWLTCFVLARIASLGIPAIALLPLPERPAFWGIVASLAIANALQSIAYTAYLSWLSDLVPRDCWGGFFALRQMANVAVLVLLPAATALVRRDWGSWTVDHDVRTAYLAVFLFGSALLWLTILPLLRLPDVPLQWKDVPTDDHRGTAARVWQSRRLRRVVISAFWLAAAQGLTQGVFFPFQARILNLSLEAYLALSSLMYLLQIPWSWAGGWISDRWGDRRPLIAGLLVVSTAMGFWMLARPGQPAWLIGAYAVWGVFGLVNVCQRNLLLRTAQPSDNAVPLALLEQTAGLLAGLTGLLGGYLLGELQSQAPSSDPVWPFMVLFAVSWLGRATAGLWLIRLEEAPET